MPGVKKSTSRRRLFLSHAAEDQEVAKTLADELIKTLPQLKVFVASAPGAIRVGNEWFQSIKENLRTAADCIVLLTPRSIERRWVWFEVGAAWGKGCRLYPVTAGGLRKGEIPQPLSPFQALSLETPNELQQFFRRIGGTLSEPEVLISKIKQAMERSGAIPPDQVPPVLKNIIDNAPVFGIFPAVHHHWHVGGRAIKDKNASFGSAWESRRSDPTGDVVFGPYVKLPIRGTFEAWFRIKFKRDKVLDDQEVIQLDISYHGIPVRIALHDSDGSKKYVMYHGVFDFSDGADSVELKVRKMRMCHLWVDFTAISKPVGSSH